MSVLMLRSRKARYIALSALIVIFAAAFFVWKHYFAMTKTDEQQPLLPVHAAGPTREAYDVIVAGTDPEGVTAAVSAARSGLKVLLVDGRERGIYGGLFTLGWLNSLDLNKSPNINLVGELEFLNKGLFQEWYDQIEGTSFDVHTAANAFNRMIAAEPNIDVLLGVKSMKPLVADKAVTGMLIVKGDGTPITLRTKSLIDATQDADMAAAAGAPFTRGREDLGDPDGRMAVTLVFKLSGVTPKVWESFRPYAVNGFDKMSAAGFTDAKDYVSSNPERVKLRGLNIGRQNDGTILINAMHIYGVDPLDPASVQEGMEIGRKEAPLIVDYLKKKYAEFAQLHYAGVAPELYVRESRHIQGEYRLRIVDLLENRDAWDAIAYGSYEVDIQSRGPDDTGAVALKPKVYGVPFRCLVPLDIDGLLVVGRAASFDTLPHGSARVVPLGMATGEAAGAAAKLAIERGVTFRELSRSEEDIGELRRRLTEQGMDLTMPEFKKPDYMAHKAYPGLKAAVSMALTFGNYDNEGFELDSPSNALRFAYNVNAVGRIHKAKFGGNAVDATARMDDPKNVPLTLDQAAYTLATAAGLQIAAADALENLTERGWLTADTLALIEDRNQLTNGDTYLLIRDVMANYAGITYE